MRCALTLVALLCGSCGAAVEDVPITADTEFRLERTECQGSCPAYSVRITADGAVSYVGFSFVRVLGPAVGQVSTGDVQRLLNDFIHANYWNLSAPQECSFFDFDLPSATTSLTWNGRSHQVVHDSLLGACAPAALTPLEREIDDVAATNQWVVCQPGPVCPRGT